MNTNEQIDFDPEVYGSDLLKDEALATQSSGVLNVIEMPRNRLTIDREHLKRMGKEIAYLRESLGNRIIGERNNWLVATKHGPYTDRDVMVMYNMADGAKEGLSDLAPADLRDGLELAEAIAQDWREDRPDSEVFIGINYGISRSINNVHFHVVSLPAIGRGDRLSPQDYLDPEHSNIPLGIDEVTVNKQFVMLLAGRFSNAPLPTSFASNPRYTQIQLDDGGVLANLGRIRDVAELAEAELIRQKIYDSGRSRWGCAISITSANQLRVGFNRRGTGVMEMNGVKLYRNSNLDQAPVSEYNAVTRAIVAYTLSRLDQ